MSTAYQIMHDYYRRTKTPGAHNKDPWFAYQEGVLRDLLTRLEVILEDEGIPGDKRDRVIRCLLYGSPHPADAVLRVEQQEQIAKLLQDRSGNYPTITTTSPPQWAWPKT